MLCVVPDRMVIVRTVRPLYALTGAALNCCALSPRAGRVQNLHARRNPFGAPPWFAYFWSLLAFSPILTRPTEALPGSTCLR